MLGAAENTTEGIQTGNWNGELRYHLGFTGLSLQRIRSRLLLPGVMRSLMLSGSLLMCVYYVSIWRCVCLYLYVVSVFHLGLKSGVLVLCLHMRLPEGRNPKQVLFLLPTPSTLCSEVGRKWWVVSSTSSYPVSMASAVTTNYVDKNTGCWIIYVSFLLT